MNPTAILSITEANLDNLIKTQNEILELLKSQAKPGTGIPVSGFLTAKEFMDAIRIRRTKFDQLVAEGKIRIVKKKRRIYVPFGEIERFFKDATVR